ncbi:retrovirus-related pol polyprotein from transposon tnt 1-94 [Lasius niger]|uniref:Retrovirus-related pol polyprotein from transposon tnt 1-94 n=1 Tax=Lasius niger TaxID=67767 RepID=A0A0J7K9E1_LASNI|nr:retrovirus-related pol polyprotein from transposon tnt 1-94 [Lasius niger]
MEVCYEDVIDTKRIVGLHYLRETGAEVKDEDLAYAMLSGLPETYDALTMTLASLEDEKFNSVEVKKALTMEYDRRISKCEDEQQKNEIAAYQTKKDSAATHHVCRHEEWFENLKRIKPEPIGTAEAAVYQDEGSLTAEGIGDIKLQVKINHKKYEVILPNVYYAPKCRRNLMSVAQIEKKGRILEFKNGLARVADGKTEPSKSIEELRQKGFVRGLDYHKTDSDLCHGCCIGKSTKVPCKRINGRQSRGILELIHSDLCGPMSVKSIGGSRYIMTLIDDYSRKTMVYFLKSKDEAVHNIKNFISKVERDKGLKIKRFRSDNGLEYCNKELRDFFDKLGIKHERSCVETPQMNGVAERTNRTLMDLVRSMLTSAKLSPCFWAEATSAAAYVRNRMIHANLENGVPEGIRNEKSPSVKHLKAYGCLAYAHLPQGRRKLDPRARACVFVGYSSQTKGYRLWDIKKEEIIQTKHVRFDETKLEYEQAEDTANQVLFEFLYDASSKRTEPIQTRSRSMAQRKTEDSDEESSNEHDEQTDVQNKKIVGASSGTEKQALDRSKKKIPNPYGFKGKPKDKVELNLIQIREPQNLEEAFSSPQSDEWIQAVEEELSNLERLETWEVVEPLVGKVCIDSKWVFKLKRDTSGKIARYKARLVARGFNQKEGIDYDQTYAPVARFAIVRFLLAMSVTFGWLTRHIDIKSAYLNGHLKEELYMRLSALHKNEETKTVKLLRPIYGLKQSEHNWNEALDGFLIEAGFTRLKSSNCTYRYDFCTFLVIYVDDIVIFSRYQKTIDKIVQMIQNKYEARDLGEITHFLGVNIERSPEGGIRMNQEAYIQELLERYGLQECRPAYIPLEPGNPISSTESQTKKGKI